MGDGSAGLAIILRDAQSRTRRPLDLNSLDYETTEK